MIRRLLDRLTHVEINVTDADIGAVGETVWVTGYRRRRPHCVSLMMSREEAAVLGEMLTDVTSETDPQPDALTVLRPGDRVLVVFRDDRDLKHVDDALKRLQETYPGVEFGVLVGADQVLVQPSEESESD